MGKSIGCVFSTKGQRQMICWFENHSNNIMSNSDYVFLISNVSSRHSGMYLQKEKFRLGMALYIEVSLNEIG